MKFKIFLQLFITFFTKQNFKIKKFDFVINYNRTTSLDPLFVIAGMLPLKKKFLDIEEEKNKIITIQRCLRFKDLKNIGKSNIHATSFYMAGLFLFNKIEEEKEKILSSILFFLLKILNFKEKELYITCFKEDINTIQSWKKINKKIPIKLKNKKENFWFYGKTGPFGPCTEIFFKNKKENIELLNIVFINFKKIQKTIFKLKQPKIDIGIGIERILKILQKQKTIFDLKKYKKINKALKLVIKPEHRYQIIDFLRSLIWILNEKKKIKQPQIDSIINKLLNKLQKLFKLYNFSTKKIFSLIQLMFQLDNFFTNQKKIIEIIKTLLTQKKTNQKKNLQKAETYLKKQIQKQKINSINFKFYETFGLTKRQIKKLFKKYQLNFNEKKFQNLKEKHRLLSLKKNSKQQILENLEKYKKTLLLYPKTENLIYSKEHKLKVSLKKICTINNKTFFYSNKNNLFLEKGGQSSDKGSLLIQKKKQKILSFYNLSERIVFSIKKTEIIPKTEEFLIRNRLVRKNTSKNHSALHFLHYFLYSKIDSTLCQDGSFINDKYFRLDVQITKQILFPNRFFFELKLNQLLQKQPFLTTKILFLSLSKLKTKKKIKAIFEEKYQNIQEKLRIIKLGKLSQEVCSGTHVEEISKIGYLKILKIVKIADQKYRFYATTTTSLQQINFENKLLNTILQELQLNNLNQVLSKLKKYQERSLFLEKILFLKLKKLLIKIGNTYNFKNKTTIKLDSLLKETTLHMLNKKKSSFFFIFKQLLLYNKTKRKNWKIIFQYQNFILINCKMRMIIKKKKVLYKKIDDNFSIFFS